MRKGALNNGYFALSQKASSGLVQFNSIHINYFHCAILSFFYYSLKHLGNNRKRSKCEICGIECSNNMALKYHMYHHTGQAELSDSEIKILFQETSPFIVNFVTRDGKINIDCESTWRPMTNLTNVCPEIGSALCARDVLQGRTNWLLTLSNIEVRELNFFQQFQYCRWHHKSFFWRRRVGRGNFPV